MVEGRGIARHGYPVWVGDRRTGVVTSGTQSPTLGVPIAMAYVAPGDAEPGTVVDVEIRDARVPARGRRPAVLQEASLTRWYRPTCATPRITNGSASTATRRPIGITAYAADQLGDIVFVELPDVGRALEQFAAFGVVESVKAVSDLFAPVSGEVDRDERRPWPASPELVNSDPYGAGWMVRRPARRRGAARRACSTPTPTTR